MEPKYKLPSDIIQKHLKTLVEYYDRENFSIRERQVRQWRKYKYYWEGLQKIWFDAEARNWKIGDPFVNADGSDAEGYYDKPINVLKAYLESLIAALSINVPVIRCVPDDAQNTLDIATAKAGDSISELVYKHNDVVLLWLHALYINVTEGLVAAHTHIEEDEKYGTVVVDDVQAVEEEHYVCPMCEEITANGADPIPPTVCPECGEEFGEEGIQKVKVPVERIVGTTTKLKSRVKIDVYGGLNVKVPIYARNQKDCPYLILAYETHFSAAIAQYSHLTGVNFKKAKDKIGTSSQGSAEESYDRWARLNPVLGGEQAEDVVTSRYTWLRPESYNYLPEEDAKIIATEYPKGVKVVMINEHFAEACVEELDDYWTLTHNPLADYLHHDPAAAMLISVQDITNDMISLALQTIEQGVTQTFVNPVVLDTETYKNQEVLVGGVTPTKPVSNDRNLGENFFQLKAATLSPEILPFFQMIQQLGQQVSGAMPSIWGGSNSSGSETASEYSMSRAQALQRLQTPWKMLTIWWKLIFGKVIRQYIENAEEDERYVKKNEVGNYVNVLIRKADLEGKIGEIELEGAEQLPVTLQQKKDVVMELIKLNNSVILQALFSPENLNLASLALGLPEFKISGVEDRNKQFEEIYELLSSAPVPAELPDDLVAAVEQGIPEAIQMAEQLMNDPMNLSPSIMPDELLDNHTLEAQVCRDWLISDAGRVTKIDNPEGYQNVLLHMKAHMMLAQQNMMAQAATAGAGQGPGKDKEKAPKDNMVEGESDVITPIQ